MVAFYCSMARDKDVKLAGDAANVGYRAGRVSLGK
jgi:hypothetical protein